MEKKQYISPLCEVITLSADLLQDAPLFGPASTPKEPYTAPKRKTEVF